MGAPACGPLSGRCGYLVPSGAVVRHWAAEAMMPGMKVTLNTAMRVRDVSRPSPQHEDNARAKVAEWPASRARPAPAPPSARGGRGGGGPRPWRPGADRGETPASRTGGGPGKGQGQAPPAPQGTGQRPTPAAARRGPAAAGGGPGAAAATGLTVRARRGTWGRPGPRQAGAPPPAARPDGRLSTAAEHHRRAPQPTGPPRCPSLPAGERRELPAPLVLRDHLQPPHMPCLA